MLPVRSFVALGDSFTEGMQDELTADGRYRGWADRVADQLAAVAAGSESAGSKSAGSEGAVAEGAAVHRPTTTAPGGERAVADGTWLRYANLAVRGRLLDEVVDEQLPLALAMAPDLVSFHAGGNDVLRPRVRLAEVARGYDRAVMHLREAGATVLLFTVLERAGGTGRLADALARRFAAFNAEIRRTAQRRGALLVDVGGIAALHDRRLWHEDRLHLAPAGHARIAAAVLEALGIDEPGRLAGAPGWWRRPLVSVAPASRRERLRTDLAWSRDHLAPWIGRRLRGVSSGDEVVCKYPELRTWKPAAGPDSGRSAPAVPEPSRGEA